MRFTIFGFVLLAIFFFSSLAFTQVTQWRDEKGTVHLEAIGPKDLRIQIRLNPNPTRFDRSREISRISG